MDGGEVSVLGELLFGPITYEPVDASLGPAVEFEFATSPPTVGEYAGGGVAGLNTNDSTTGGRSSKMDFGIFIGL
jgi:hypothetical protein